MVFGIICCVLALLWAGTAYMLGYCLYDCWDIISRTVSCLLVCGVIAAVVECILLMGIGIARIAGYQWG